MSTRRYNSRMFWATARVAILHHNNGNVSILEILTLAASKTYYSRNQATEGKHIGLVCLNILLLHTATKFTSQNAEHTVHGPTCMCPILPSLSHVQKEVKGNFRKQKKMEEKLPTLLQNTNKLNTITKPFP